MRRFPAIAMAAALLAHGAIGSPPSARASSPARAERGDDGDGGSERPSPLRLELIDTELAELPFGEDPDEAMAWVRTRLEEAYGPRMEKAGNSQKRHALRQRMKQELEKIRSSLVAFDGHRTGYEVSVIAGEFVPGARESLLHFSRGDDDHYLFFSDGELWKYGRPLDTERSFDERLDAYVDDHGDPIRVDRERRSTREQDDGKGEKRVAEAVWKGQRYRVRLLNRRLLYDADLLVVEHRDERGEVLERRGGKDVEAADEGVDPAVRDFLESSDAEAEAPDDEGSDDATDQGAE